MNRRAASLALAAGLGLAATGAAAVGDGPARHFAFGPTATGGAVAVPPDLRYSAARGHGFDDPAGADALVPALAGPQRGHAVLAPRTPLRFSVDLPEGRWRVTATLGGTAQASDTTLRAELRRLVLHAVRTAPGEVRQQQFTVHVRTPQIPAGAWGPAGTVQLRGTREAVEEALNWDQRLTLEIAGPQPALQTLRIEPANTPVLFVLGDSTVADQPADPYASWGQMLPRWFDAGLAVASLAQSGETYRDALARRRVDKILSLAQPGDTVLMQYGHNDQKQLRDGSGSVHSFQDEIRRTVALLRAGQLQPVLATPVERRFFEPDGTLRRTLAEHAQAVRAVAAELGVPLLDLNEASRRLYLALGPVQAPAAFAVQADGRVDPTHHNGYGAWLLAGLVARGLRELGLPVAARLRPDAPVMRAEAPPPPQAVPLPPGPAVARERPPGDGEPGR